jgi:hypothetical protein
MLSRSMPAEALAGRSTRAAELKAQRTILNMTRSKFDRMRERLAAEKEAAE